MRICLYSPYIPKHLGGGEKYFFDVAVLLAEEHEVVVALPADISANNIPEIRSKYESFLNCDLSKVRFTASPLFNGSSLQKALWTRNFDVCFVMTDGSFFFSLAKKNIVHIQIPFTQEKTGITERAKLAWWSTRNANSAFTRAVVEKAWQTKIQYLHYPMIGDECFQPLDKKEKIILNVGRFFRQLHSKRQDIIVKTFRQLTQQEPKLLKDWKVVLVGAIEDQSYLDEVKALAEGLPIEFHHQMNRQELLKRYQTASIYWHAAGFEVDQEAHPEMVEHFGISTAEAMASGCIPLVVGKGGQVEVLGTELAHLQWQTIDECCAKTAHLLEKPETWPQLQSQAVAQTKTFSRARFRQTLYEMIQP